MIAHVDKPLEADQGFYYCAAPLAVAYRMTVIFHFLQEAQALQLGNYLLPSLKALSAGVLSRLAGHVGVEADDGGDLQMVALANSEVQRVVAGALPSGLRYRIQGPPLRRPPPARSGP